MKNKKIITQIEQKKIMLNMLAFVDTICRKNDIKYSLIAGSLIGAIRHRGYIPWDDDIDIILTKDNYDKLKKILENTEGEYKLLEPGRGGECFSFMKLIDTRTRLIEPIHPDFGKDYGVYIDIFCYYPTSNDATLRARHYKKIKTFKTLLSRRKIDLKNYSLLQNSRWACKNMISKLLGYEKIKMLFEESINQYVNEDTDYLLHNWPTYGIEKEVQLKKNIQEYIDAEFEGLKVMIFKNYDEILRVTYGDYMQLPPESERVSRHNVTAWWKESEDAK